MSLLTKMLILSILILSMQYIFNQSLGTPKTELNLQNFPAIPRVAHMECFVDWGCQVIIQKD
jgi:hypothetical protein